ncbi:MAG TPA: helix-hairpin-helix domain-containing protein [Ruminiclostridium sp.]
MEITVFGKQFFINKVLFFCLIVFLIIVSGVLGYFLKQVYQPLSNSDIEESNTKIIQSEVTDPSDEILKAEQEVEVKVYITGCVNKPGVVTIKKGQVIDDVIKIAGGATKEADLQNINLAYKLNENTMLRIKSKVVNVVSTGSATKTSSNKAVATASPTSSKAYITQKQSSTPAKAGNTEVADSNKMNSGVDIVTDSLGAVVVADDEEGDSSKKNSLININKALQTELENLPNVGPATAKAIIDYREKNDGFKKITDIMKITGIKQKTYDKIKELICIE